MWSSDEAAPRKLSHSAAREEQRRYWKQLSPAERLAESDEMKQRMDEMRGINTNEQEADLTPRRVSPRRVEFAVEAADLLDDEENLRFGPENDYVDILASIGELSFDQVWANRVETVVEGTPVPLSR